MLRERIWEGCIRMRYTEDIEVEETIRNLVGGAAGEYFEGYDGYWEDDRETVEHIKHILDNWSAKVEIWVKEGRR